MAWPKTPHVIADNIAALLAIYLGPYTAHAAVRAFSLDALGRPPDTLTPEDVPALAEALRPVLRTFVGRAQAAILVEDIKRWSGPS